MWRWNATVLVMAFMVSTMLLPVGCGEDKVVAPQKINISGEYRGIYMRTLGGLEYDTLGFFLNAIELSFTLGDSTFVWEQINVSRGEHKASDSGVYRMHGDSIDLVIDEPVWDETSVRGIVGRFWFSYSEDLLTLRRELGSGLVEGVYLVRED